MVVSKGLALGFVYFNLATLPSSSTVINSLQILSSAFVISEQGEKIKGKTKFSGVTMAAYRISLPDLEMES